MTISKYSKYIISLPLFVIFIGLILTKYFKDIGVDISNHEIIGLSLAFLFAAFLYIDKKLSDIAQKPSIGITTDTLNGCMNAVEDRIKHVQYLRIFANNTLHTYPAISNASFTVDRCDLLVRKTNTMGKEGSKKFNTTVENMIYEWRQLEKKGKIKTLNIRYYDTSPTEWHILIDQDFLIKGLCYPIDKNWKDIDLVIDETMLIQNTGDETKKLIGYYIKRFDAFYKNSNHK